MFEVLIGGILLLFALHCIGDYPLQGDFIAVNKGKNRYVLCVHCAIYTLCILVGFLVIALIEGYKIEFGPVISAVVILFLTHMLIDKWKCECRTAIYSDTTLSDGQREAKDCIYFYWDQILHMIINFILLIILILRN